MYFPIVELLFVQSFHVGTNRKCFYGFDDNYTKVECDESQYEMFCFKGTIDNYSFRGCWSEPNVNTTCNHNFDEQLNETTIVCYCNTDYCNSSSKFQSSFFMLFLLSALEFYNR